MASITHFSHEHPLIPKQIPAEEAYINSRFCYGCGKYLIQNSKVYGCEICETIFLQKSCAQLPMEIIYKSHKQHSLFLLSNKPSAYGNYKCCKVCKGYLEHNFFYHCYLDDFDVDMKCALKNKEVIVGSSKELILYHPSHKHHQLKLQPKPSSFLCDACDVEDTDSSYQCTSCHYWIHRRCAMLPSPNNLDVHAHPLSLAFVLPSQYHNFPYYCGICKETIERTQQLWLYYCDLCRYFIHIKCIKIKKPQIEIDLKGLHIDDLLRLPGSDKSVELIQRFLLENYSHENVQEEISVFSHKHPLKCSNDQLIIDYESEDGEQLLCDGCIEPINSPPYYHCAECRYFLHIPCAELPHEHQHPSHPHHPLTLTSPTKIYEHLYCYDCGRYSNGFFFCCTSEGHDIRVDVKCSALPNIIQQEAHNHPLFQMVTATYVQIYCSGCSHRIWGQKLYGCEPCKFYLHQRCLLLQKTRKSKFDNKHLLALRFPPHYYHPRPLDCYQCEAEIDPNYWLYHCEVCELSFHVYCLPHPSMRFGNSKFGQKLQIISHPHPLKYVFPSSVKSPCHRCGHLLLYEDDAMECETCNFHLCLRCIRKLDSLEKLEK